jgi:signal transduction histidine kinase
LSLITTASTAMELKKEMNKLNDNEFELFTKKILDATKYLSDTISNFRNFFQQNKKIQKIFVHNVIEKSKQLLETKLKGKNIQIIYLPSKELCLYGLENDLIQITTNLFSNSIDALENVDEAKRLIIIQAFETDEMLQLEFQDSGGGIDQEHLNNIFTLYFTTKPQEKGSGVGLHMCKTIIENNFHGSIQISNKYFLYDDYKYYGANFVLNFKKQ